MSNKFNLFCEKNDIIHDFSAPYTPKQNGVAERKNRTVAYSLSYSLFVRAKINLLHENSVKPSRFSVIQPGFGEESASGVTVKTTHVSIRKLI